MKFCTFASGSSGNCALVSCGGTSVLIDAGISMRRIKTSLAACGIHPEELGGILITHSHSDHISGLAMMCKYYQTPVFAPRVTAGVLARSLPGAAERIRPFEPGSEFRIGELTVGSFRTPHDSYDSVGYILSSPEGRKLAFATDFGRVTSEVLEAVGGANAAVIESNHDVEMLRRGPYPYYLKRRIADGNGHLSNDDCAFMAAELCRRGASRLVLAHLSRENNTPALAYGAVRSKLEESGVIPGENIALSVAPRGEPGDFFTV